MGLSEVTPLGFRFVFVVSAAYEFGELAMV